MYVSFKYVTLKFVFSNLLIIRLSFKTRTEKKNLRVNRIDELRTAPTVDAHIKSLIRITIELDNYWQFCLTRYFSAQKEQRKVSNPCLFPSGRMTLMSFLNICFDYLYLYSKK